MALKQNKKKTEEEAKEKKEEEKEIRDNDGKTQNDDTGTAGENVQEDKETSNKEVNLLLWEMKFVYLLQSSSEWSRSAT